MRSTAEIADVRVGKAPRKRAFSHPYERQMCYIQVMATTEDKLENLFAKVRALPRARQELAVEALSEIAEVETYKFSDEERAVLEPALDRAKRGEFAPDADIDEALNKPWS